MSSLGPCLEHLFIVLEVLGLLFEYLLFAELLGPFPEHLFVS